MIINHNISALNTYRQLSINVTSGSKSLEKLSSGYRINRAGDDAAGLAISEKMRSQIRGLNQASRNAQDGISLIQTAEGALNEAHSILQRMRELAVQAANDTNTASDRAEIQKEINQLTSEINRIANTTEFNTKKVLDGGAAERAIMGGGGTPAVLTGLKDIGFGGGDGEGSEAQSATITGGDISTLLATDINIGSITLNDQEITLTTVDVLDGSGTAVTWEELIEALQTDIDTVFDGEAFDGVQFIVSQNEDGNGITISTVATGSSATIEIKADAGSQALGLTDGTTDAAATGTDATGGAADFSTISDPLMLNGQDVTLTNVKALGTDADMDKLVEALQKDINEVFDGTAHGGVTFTVGNDGDKLTITSSVEGADSRVTITANAASELLGLTEDASTNNEAEGTGTDDGGAFTKDAVVTNGTTDDAIEYALDISSHENATNAISVIDNAISKVSGERSKMGAYQNRLEHTINNLGTSAENLTAAESRIRDVDMAKEMMEFTKNSILQQAAQAMLAQANQLPQGVLQLLR